MAVQSTDLLLIERSNTLHKASVSDLGIPDKTVLGYNTNAGTAVNLDAVTPGEMEAFTSGSAVVVTIRTNATAAVDTLTVFHLCQKGAGVLTVDAAVGVTLNGVSGGSVAIANRYGVFTVQKIATDEWLIFGALDGAVA